MTDHKITLSFVLGVTLTAPNNYIQFPQQKYSHMLTPDTSQKCHNSVL